MDIALWGIFQSQTLCDGEMTRNLKGFNDPDEAYVKIDEILSRNHCEFGSEWKNEDFPLRSAIKFFQRVPDSAAGKS